MTKARLLPLDGILLKRGFDILSFFFLVPMRGDWRTISSHTLEKRNWAVNNCNTLYN